MRAIEQILLDVLRSQNLPDAAGVARKSADLAEQAVRDAKIYDLSACMTVAELQTRFGLKRSHIYRIINRQLKIRRVA